METAIVTSAGQLLVPERLRKKYGMEAGVKVIFEELEGGLILRPMNKKYFKAFRGMLPSSGQLKEEIKEMKLQEKKLEDRKLNIYKTIKKK